MSMAGKEELELLIEHASGKKTFVDISADAKKLETFGANLPAWIKVNSGPCNSSLHELP